MKKILFIALVAMSAASLCSCGHSDSYNDQPAQQIDSTLCQYSNIKMEKMYSYYDEERDTLYFDNKFTALWPEVINGKPCTELQQALLRAMVDSAELDQLDKVTDFLLNPSSYTDYDSKLLMPVKRVKYGENKLSTSEVRVIMESMTDRLLTYRLSTNSYMAGAVHGIYANNYVTYDLKTEKAVSLGDIIADTTLLRKTILKSIKHEYDYDKDQLFIPDNGLLPLPRDFFIDGMVLHAVYQVYEIASYAQGAIDAPIYPYMVKPEEMKQLFTPYGLELIDYSE